MSDHRTGTDLLSAISEQPVEMTPKLEFLDWAAEEHDTVRQWIAAAMEKEPRLTINGIELNDPHLAKQNADAVFQHQREILRDETQAFAACLTWLAACKKRNTVSAGESSYGYKHRVEKCFSEIGVYVPNGAFIAAAIHAGFSYEIVPCSLNTLHGISRLSLRKLKR
jgi:hypothetical protein